MDYYVVLNDGDTFSSLSGCTIVGVYELNEAAQEAAEQGFGKDLVRLADEVIDIESNITTLSEYSDDPRCDICGRLEGDSPNVFDYGAATETDWNGNTGNHLYCEENLVKSLLRDINSWKEYSENLARGTD